MLRDIAKGGSEGDKVKKETKLFLRKLRKLQRRLRTRDRSSQRKEQPKVTNIISIQVIEIVHIHSNINILALKLRCGCLTKMYLGLLVCATHILPPS